MSRPTPLLIFTALAASCAALTPPPVIEARRYGKAEAALVRVAVAPFEARAVGPRAADGRDLVERFVTEELARQGIEVVPAHELRIALQSPGPGAMPSEPGALADIAERKFKATGLLTGEVTRFRERSGERRGSASPASVAFRITLHAAPTGKRLWLGKFDETQAALTEAPARARRYPDSGTRWLSAAELAHWGAKAAAETLAERR